jgi:TonB-linked SusC/RagA family outer membrane protein
MMKQVKSRIPVKVMALLFGLFLSVSAFAQQITVNGHVKDATGEAIIGATVRVEGQDGGTVSDFDGNFTLKAKQGATITVSYVGYTNATAVAAPNVVITLKEDNKTLNEVLVIGYGTVKKSDATGSVLSVQADQLNKGLATSPADLLQGKAPGVQIVGNSGAPGAGSTIRIRGGSSLSASNDPLIVIDGLPISSTSISGQSDVLSTINPNDIESFSILKDASATAIYGSRASNGVIVITTKKGVSGKPKVNIDLTGSFQNVSDKVDVMNASDFTNFFNSYFANHPELDAASAKAALGTSSTNWQDKIYRTAWTEEVNASVTGGIKGEGKTFNSLPYRVSAGFLNDDGTLKTSNMKRATASFNLTPQFFDKHLTLNLNAKGVYTKNRFADEGAIGAAVQYDPCLPVYDANGLNGYTSWMVKGAPNTMSTLNPVAMLDQENKTSNVRRFVGNAQFDYKFFYVPGLRANLNLGLDISTSNGWNLWDQGSEVSYHDKTQNGSGLWEKYTQLRRDQTLEFYLNYVKDVPSIYSKFDVMGGYSWQHFFNRTTDNKLSADGKTSFSTTPLFKTESYLVSFYGRFNYTFMDRYLLTFTLRDDGTSRFQNNKWGLFPSAAFAWRISEEKFIKDIDWISNLKLRLGYGITGQQNIGQGDYPSIATYHTNQAGSLYQFGNELITPITPKSYNGDLKWESTTTYNVGIDFGFLRERINGSFDVYQRKTKDLLNFVPVSAGSYLSNYALMNVGDLKNTGFEFALNVVPIENKDWRWEAGFNISYNKNKITKLTANTNPNYIGVLTGNITGGTGNTVQIDKVGYAANSFYVYQQVYDKNGNPIDGLYVDRNGDGQINDNDRYVYKKPDPDVNLGFNTSLSYKKWTLSASLRASFNNYVYDNVASNNEMMADMWTNNFICNRLNSAATSMFRQAQYNSDYYVHNASYLKLDRITLAYNVASWIRLHITAQNVFTITNYDGVDPEVQGGIDNNMYPRPRTILFGASLNF